MEASTQNISREVSNVHRDVVAVLNLLLQPTKRHQNEQRPTPNDSQLAANHGPVLRDAVAATSLQIKQASAPDPPEIVPPPAYDPQALAFETPKPLLAEYALSTHDLSATATIVLVAASNQQNGASQTTEVLAATKDYGDRDGSAVDAGTPAEAVKLNSTIARQGSDPTPRQCFVRAPANFKSNSIAATRRAWTDGHVHSRAVRASSDKVTVGVGSLVSGWRRCGLDSDDGSGGRTAVWSQSVLLSGKESPLSQHRSLLEQEELLVAAGGDHRVVARQGSAALGAEAPSGGGTPQPRRSSKGRWSTGLYRRGGSGDDSSAGLEPAAASHSPA